MSSTGTCHCVIVISGESGITNACGNTMFVTRTWVCASSMPRSAKMRKPHGAGSWSSFGLWYSRSTRVIGMSELADVARNCRP